jgi:hypothetical protein
MVIDSSIARCVRGSSVECRLEPGVADVSVLIGTENTSHLRERKNWGLLPAGRSGWQRVFQERRRTIAEPTQMTPTITRRRLLATEGIGLTGVGGGYVLFDRVSGPSTPTCDSSPPAKLGPPALGDSNVPVTVAEYVDYSCPHCRDYALNVFPQIHRDSLRQGRSVTSIMISRSRLTTGAVRLRTPLAKSSDSAGTRRCSRIRWRCSVVRTISRMVCSRISLLR